MRAVPDCRLFKDIGLAIAKQPFFRPIRLAAAVAAAPLAGCSGVLDPAGPVGAAQRLILINSVAIMLAIVIPVVVADRRLRLLVPRLQPARLLLAGLGVLRPSRADRLGDPDARRRRARRRRLVRVARPRSLPAASSADEAGRGPGRLARLEVAVHLSRRRRRERQRARGPGRRSRPFHHHVERRDEQLLRAAARQPDLRDGGHGDAALAAGRPSRDLSRLLGATSAATVSPTCTSI